MTVPEEKIRCIEREHRIAMATRPTETDSWLNGYRDDVGTLLEGLRAALAENQRLREDALTWYMGSVRALAASAAPRKDL